MKKILLTLFFLLSACTFSKTDSENLIGLTDKQILRRFNSPTVTRTESPYQLWSYRQETCTILLYFDDTNTVRFVDFSGNC